MLAIKILSSGENIAHNSPILSSLNPILIQNVRRPSVGMRGFIPVKYLLINYDKESLKYWGGGRRYRNILRTKLIGHPLPYHGWYILFIKEQRPEKYRLEWKLSFDVCRLSFSIAFSLLLVFQWFYIKNQNNEHKMFRQIYI